MAKSTTKFVCSSCGYQAPKWMGRCPSCNEWNTLIEEVVSQTSQQFSQTRPALSRPLPVSAIQAENFQRFTSGMEELDNVLGGGIVPASLVLIGGDPGIGKSTLLTQVASYVSQSKNVLYISAEESTYQVKMRCDRLGQSPDKLFILSDSDMDEICAHIESGTYGLCIIDSIQAVYSSQLSSAAGSVSQVRECAARLMKLAKSIGTTIFIVGHVTKEGSIAGPKILEHIMDTVLYFEGEGTGAFKLLRAVKNRFGSTNELGIFEMKEDGIYGVKNPSEILLSDNRGKSAGAVATTTMEGSRCMLVELQSLVCASIFGIPRRTALGIDYNKLVLLLAVLEKRGGLSLSSSDVYINIMGGIRIVEPAIDLAIILATASAVQNIAIPKETAVFGEVGLTGEVRAVSHAEKRIQECIRLGFNKVILPKSNLKVLEKYQSKITLVGVNHVYTALRDLNNSTK